MKREDQRVILRELHPRGWIAVDDIDEITLGHAPNMSHVTARLEIRCNTEESRARDRLIRRQRNFNGEQGALRADSRIRCRY
jgi:ATPase MipZ